MEREFLERDSYHRPTLCENCGGVMIFKGVGEYRCEDCSYVEYDDYGKVRLYLEKNSGATITQVEEGTGVKQKIIRQMLKEGRLEVTANSKTFLKCEICGAPIRSGNLCAKCEQEYHRKIEEEQRKKKRMQGYGKAVKGEEGERRFQWPK